LKKIWKKIKSFFNNLVDGESPSDIPLKKDGTPDRRYIKNK